MFGLIKKDLFMIKSNLKIFVVLMFVYGFMAYQGEMSLSFVLPFMSVVIMISTFSYDTFNKWDAYVITLPDGRKRSIMAKYLTTILLIIVTAIIVSVLSIVISYTQNNMVDFENILSTMLGAIFATALMQSFMYPSIYKFGVEKARIGTFIVVFGIAIIGGIIAKFVDFSFLIDGLKFIDNYFSIILPLVMILMLFISYKVSLAIYKKKEF